MVWVVMELKVEVVFLIHILYVASRFNIVDKRLKC